MRFPATLIQAELVTRYKRFLADVSYPDGEVETVRCPNTGKLSGCAEPGNKVWLLPDNNPRNKYAKVWELVEDKDGELVCIHAVRANRLVADAIEQKQLKAFDQWQIEAREVAFPDGNGRADLLLMAEDEQRCYVEIKSVTLHLGNGLGVFPDARSTRAVKHLKSLCQAIDMGFQAALVYCVMHTGITKVSPADQIDTDYGVAFRNALKHGVKVFAYDVHLDTQSITVNKPCEVLNSLPQASP